MPLDQYQEQFNSFFMVHFIEQQIGTKELQKELLILNSQVQMFKTSEADEQDPF